MSTREKVDIFLNKWVSRKLTVFVVASIGLFSGVITSTDWVIVATSYITIEGITTIVERLFKAKVGSI
jgi:hypothetical protein